MGFFSNRRNRIIEKAIKSLVASGRTEADFPQIYFDAARRYAHDHGAEDDREYPDVIGFTKEFCGEERFIMFSKMWSGGGTNIGHSPPLNIDDLLPTNKPVKLLSHQFEFTDWESNSFGDHLISLEEQSRPHSEIIRGPYTPMAEIESYYRVFGIQKHGIAPLWWESEGVLVGGGILSFEHVGDCFVWTAASPNETFLMSSQIDFEGIDLKQYHDDPRMREIVDAMLLTVFRRWKEMMVGDVPYTMLEKGR